MSFALLLATDVVEAEAGATTPVALTVVNKGAATDRLEIEVEGLDHEWLAIPVPVFPIEPGESRSEKVFLKPPRLPESVAGAYPFVVRVRSLESGESRDAQGLLRLNAFHHVTMEINPKKGVISPTTHRNDFRLTLVNLGNSEHTLQLSAQDPEERCAYEFDEDVVTLGPGGSKSVEMTADPKSNPVLGSGRLIGFSVFARSQNERSVTATAQAQLEQRPLLSPGALIAALALAAAAFGWWSMRPKPPTIDLSFNPPHALADSQIEVRYTAQNADHVKIEMTTGPETKETVYDGPPTNAPVVVTLKGEGQATFTATATHDGRDPVQDIEHVQIDEAPVVPKAEILGFKAPTPRVKVGTNFVVRWSVNRDTKTVTIAPGNGVQVDANLKEIQLTAPETPGEQVYTLYAYDVKGNNTDRKTLKVSFYDESDAQILAFAAAPPKAKEEEGGHSTVTWQANTASVRVELTVGSNAPEVVEPTGTRELTLTGKTKCVLTASDDKGRRVVKSLWIDFEKKPIVIEPTNPDTSGATTAGTPPPDPDFPDKIPPPTTGP